MAAREAPGVKTFQLKRKAGVGFGIALSGGAGQQPAPNQHDQGIYISDVVQAGPAQGRLMINDKLIMVGGKSCMGMSRAEVVNMLRSAGQVVSLSVVRQSDLHNPQSNQPQSKNPSKHHAPSHQQTQQPNGQNHSYSDGEKSTYYTDDEEDYMQKAPLENSRQHTNQSHNQSQNPHNQSNHNQSHHNTNNQQNPHSAYTQQPPQHSQQQAPSQHHQSQHNTSSRHPQPSERMTNMPMLEPNTHCSYGNIPTPAGTMVVGVNQPEAEKIVLQKDQNQQQQRFGIQFGTQLVVRDVMQGSLASKFSEALKPGDVILSVNGKDVSHLSKEAAMKIAAKNKNQLELLVRKVSGMTVTVPVSASNFDQFSTGGNNTIELAPREERSADPVENDILPEAQVFEDPNIREVVFKKSSKSLGIRLEGGNNVGIFIANIQNGSPAEGRGLRVGDKILEVNETNFRNATHEKAINNLMSLRQGDVVKIKVKHSPDAFDKCQETGIRDQFYIRTHFKFDGDRNEPQWNIKFNKGEVFLVYDTLYMGQLGNWQASRIDHRNRQGTRGIIPNLSRAENIKKAQDARLEKLRLGHVNKLLQRFKTGNQISKPVRQNATAPSGAKYDGYERVVLREASFRRPVVFFGPVADVARDLLVRESSLDFEVAEEVNNPNARPGRKGVVKIQAINDIIARDKHAVLDITPNAVDKLNYAQLYPICVYLKSQNRNRIKQIRDRFHASKKNPKKLIDRAAKLDRSYRHVFTDVLDIDKCGRGREWTDELFRRIHDQQHLLVWVSEQHETVDNEEDELDNEQDRFSYVSAPASDYSVTTVGTELAHQEPGEEDEDDMDETNGTLDHRNMVEKAPKPADRRNSPGNYKQESEEEEEEEHRPFGVEDLVDEYTEKNIPVPYRTKKRTVQDSATSPVHYPPPPPEETGPGRMHGYRTDPVRQEPRQESRQEPRSDPYARDQTYRSDNRAAPAQRTQPAYAPPLPKSATRTTGSQYDFPPMEPEPKTSQPPPHQEEWPAPVQSSTVRSYQQVQQPEPVQQIAPNRFDPESILAERQQNRYVPQNAFQVPQHQPQHIQPQYQPVQQQQQQQPHRVEQQAPPPQHHSPQQHQPMQQQQMQQQPMQQQPPQQQIYAQPPVQQAPAPPMHQQPSPVHQQQPVHQPQSPQPQQQQQPTENSVRSHQPRPFGQQSSNQPKKPTGYYMSQKTNFQSSWNPHPRGVKDDIPSGTVSSRINQFANHTPPSQSNYTPPPPKSGQHQQARPQESSNPRSTSPQQPVHQPTQPVAPKKDVVATARGIFDYNGGVLSSLETGVSLVIPEGAIPYGNQQEIYFKVCQDENSLPTPANPAAGERLMSPMVMCGPHGLKFEVPIELRLPHRPERDPQDSLNLTSNQPDEESVSILIDHF